MEEPPHHIMLTYIGAGNISRSIDEPRCNLIPIEVNTLYLSNLFLVIVINNFEIYIMLILQKRGKYVFDCVSNIFN
jgi:hypothetical protein